MLSLTCSSSYIGFTPSENSSSIVAKMFSSLKKPSIDSATISPISEIPSELTRHLRGGSFLGNTLN